MIRVGVLSERALARRLRKLRGMLAGRGGDVLFMSPNSITRRRALKRAVKRVEPYIPRTVSPDGMKELLRAADGGIEAARRFERRLSKKSVSLFLRAAMGAGNDEEWDALTDMCEMIRKYRASMSF